jgi:hypothetical protein
MSKITFNGETLLIKEWAERLGVSLWAMSKRKAKGWPFEKIFSTPSLRKLGPRAPRLVSFGRPRRGESIARLGGGSVARAFTWNGKTQPLSEWSRELNVSKKCLERRLFHLHWSIDEAFGIPVLPHGNKRSQIKADFKPWEVVGSFERKGG